MDNEELKDAAEGEAENDEGTDSEEEEDDDE